MEEVTSVVLCVYLTETEAADKSTCWQEKTGSKA